MRFVYIIALIALFAVSGRAPADTWLVGTVASYHTNRDIERNERNWGLGLERDFAENWRYTVGGYRNSYWRNSYYAGAQWLPWRFGSIRIGAMAGGVTGYTNSVDPMILPTIAIEGKQFGVNLGVMPHVKRGVGVLGLQLKTRF